jgi:hypothetical protein
MDTQDFLDSLSLGEQANRLETESPPDDEPLPKASAKPQKKPKESLTFPVLKSVHEGNAVSFPFTSLITAVGNSLSSSV